MKHVFGRQGNNGWTYGALMERPRPGERPRGAVRLPSPGAAEGWFPAGFAAGVAEHGTGFGIGPGHRRLGMLLGFDQHGVAGVENILGVRCN